jgi:hypothetical protein
VNRARVLAGFIALGLFWGAWGAALPGVQRRAAVSDGELGVALLLVGLGALASMRATGHLMDRHGSRVTAWAVGALGLCGVLPGLASSFWELSLSLLVVGGASGATDVAINAEGVWAEDASGRPLLNLAHASFSGSVVVASVSVGGLRVLGGSSALALAAAGAIVFSIAVALGASARDGRRDDRGPKATKRVSRSREGWGARPPRWLVLLGAMTALAYWVENAWQSWSAVHLAGDLSAGAGVSALGPAAFAGAAAIGRLFGQRLIGALGDRTLITAGATVAAIGTALAAAAPTAALGIAGIMLAGAGTSVCAPTIISLAGAAAPPERRGAAVSIVTSIAYLGFLVGPAGVGALAALTSLRSSLTAVSALALGLAAIAALAPLPARRRSRAVSRD